MLNSFDLQTNTDLELDMAAILGTETPNFYSQGFSTVPSIA
jgi:hypothetical protein